MSDLYTKCEICNKPLGDHGHNNNECLSDDGKFLSTRFRKPILSNRALEWFKQYGKITSLIFQDYDPVMKEAREKLMEILKEL
jgi:hypothetical protein